MSKPITQTEILEQLHSLKIYCEEGAKKAAALINELSAVQQPKKGIDQTKVINFLNRRNARIERKAK